MIQFDLPTLMVAETFVVLCAGIVLVYAGWQARNRALLLWGSNSLVAAVGISAFLAAAMTGAPIFFVPASLAVLVAGGLIWAAARVFAGKRAPAAIVFAGAAGGLAFYGLLEWLGLANVAAGSQPVIVAAYLFAAAATLLEKRSERLAARPPVIALLALHGGLLAVGGLSVMAGFYETDTMPPIGSLFGLIHFENFIFALGTSVFFLAMNKERSEHASKVAAHTDGLTGVANRRSFMEGAERVLDRCRRDGVPMALVMFDLDRFKGINDGHGHGTGDRVIQHFARVVRDAMRPTDLFGRIGGEEFCMALPGADIDAAFARADRIRIEFSRATFATADEIIRATVSAGVAVAEAGGTLTMLLADADAALYRAKADGRNRVAKASSGKGRSVLRVA